MESWRVNTDEIQLSMPVQVIWFTVSFCSLQESLCGTGDLSHVTSLEICVNTQENTLGNFGKQYNMEFMHKITAQFGFFTSRYITDIYLLLIANKTTNHF